MNFSFDKFKISPRVLNKGIKIYLFYYLEVFIL